MVYLPCNETVNLQCVLTGIVFAAMKGMLVNVKDFFVAWRQSKMDGCIWMVTFCSVILIDIDIGLCVGVIASLLHITILGQKIKVTVLGNIPRTDFYVEKDRYQSVSIECNLFRLAAVSSEISHAPTL